MLSPEQRLRLAIYCVSEERKARHSGKVPGVQGWEDELVESLAQELAEVSRTRQSGDSDPSHLQHETWISTSEAAAMTGWGMRRLQRRADKFGARPIGGRLAFPLSAIREHIEGAA